MLDKLSDISIFTKFVVALIIYTGYLAWHAAQLSGAIQSNTKAITHLDDDLAAHVIADYQITLEFIKLAQTVKHIEDNQNKNNEILEDTIKQHAACGAIMENMLKRLEKVENAK